MPVKHQVQLSRDQQRYEIEEANMKAAEATERYRKLDAEKRARYKAVQKAAEASLGDDHIERKA